MADITTQLHHASVVWTLYFTCVDLLKMEFCLVCFIDETTACVQIYFLLCDMYKMNFTIDLIKFRQYLLLLLLMLLLLLKFVLSNQHH